MSENNDDKDKKSPKNPWGNNKDDKSSPHNPWGVVEGGGGTPPPDLDDLLRKAQDNFNDIFPGGPEAGKFGVFGIVLIALVGLWLASGFYIVEPGKQVVIQRFGAWDRTQTQEGLGYHLPAPFESGTKVDVAQIRRMNIGFLEGFTSSGERGQRSLPEESLMLTADRNIVDLNLVIQWNIKSAEDFLFKIQDQENTIKKVAESAIREAVGQTDMFRIITTARDDVANRAKAIIQENLDEYSSGVNITQVLIEKAEVHPDVQDAFQDVQSAKQDAEDVQNRAQAYREDILPKARGQAIKMLQEAEAYKQSVIARATGDADRFNAVYEAYLTGKDVTKERLYIEAMEEVLKNAEKIVIDQDGQGSGVVPYLPLDQLNNKRSQ